MRLELRDKIKPQLIITGGAIVLVVYPKIFLVDLLIFAVFVCALWGNYLSPGGDVLIGMRETSEKSLFCHPEPCPELVSWVVSGS